VTGTLLAETSPAAQLGAVAAHGLPARVTLPDRPLDDAAFAALLDQATVERVTPLLAVAVADGAFPVTDAQAARVATAHERAMRLCVLLERALLDTLPALEMAGVAVRVLKGPAVARLDYPDPAWRAFGDVDLLVTSEDYDRALGALQDLGGRRRFTEVRPGFDRRWGKGACVVAPDGTQIDVHRTFVAGPFGLTVDLPGLFLDPAPVALGGREVLALDRVDRFLHACFHAALGDQVARVATLRDVAQLLTATDLDVEAALARATGWRADAVVARAVRLTWSRLALEPHPVADWALAHRADRFQLRALRAYTGASRSYATQVVAGLSAVRGVPAKVAYVRALLLPDARHLAARDRSHARRLQRALRTLGSGRSAR
jgi:hypothetical protein